MTSGSVACIALAGALSILVLQPAAHAGAPESAPNPGEQARWAESGFGPEDALAWRRVGIGPAEARAWVAAGIQYAEWAAQWKGEGFGPADASQWVRTANVYTAGEFRQRGFSPADATAWMSQGILSALRAEEFRKLGLAPPEAGRWWKLKFFPADVASWRDGGFGPEEALEWKYGPKEYLNDGVSYSRSVFSVQWAREWRDAGFASDEAKRAAALGIPFREAREWQRAAFSFKEALAWRDSGFAPAEAARSRAEGYTPVQAEERREAAATQLGDEIASLHADIDLMGDGSVSVTETFEVLNRPDGTIRGCFERVLPARIELRFRGGSFRTARPIHDRLTGSIDGSPVPMDVTRDSSGDRTLCIGGKGSRLPEGRHTLTIRYLTDDRLIARRSHEELFFDVTGRILKLPVRRASATVRLPEGADVVFADGFAGLRDRKDFTARVRELHGSDFVDYAVWRPLKPEMGFQVSVGFTKGFVKTSLWTQGKQLDRRSGGLMTSIGVLVLGLACTCGYYLIAWNRVGRDPPAGLVLREFEPPAGVSPALIRYILRNRRVDDTGLAAALVHLAQHGAIRIDERGGAYQMRKTGIAEGCAPHEQVVLAAVFGNSERLVIGIGRARSILRAARSSMKRALGAEYRRYFVLNSRYLWPGLLLSVSTLACSLLALNLGDGGKSGAFLASYLAIQLGIFGILTLPCSFLLKTPTQEGRTLLDRIAGYRDTLAANFRRETGGMGDPGISPSLARHLPYAMALGIETDRIGYRWVSTQWFGGSSGGFSARDFTEAIRRRVPGGRTPA